jgi:Peroxiredoxin
MPVTVGDAAPQFELLGKEWGKDAPTYKLSDALAKGGVVLQFFPLPFTGTCEAQMCAVRDHIGAYTGAGVTVYGVTGHYPMLLKAWDDEHHFGAVILADYDREISIAYVGLYEDPLPSGLRLAAKRGVVGISPDGIVRSVWISEIPGVAPDEEVVKVAIAAARG